MAPKVRVPADFGRHHIGAPSHGNFTFNLREGVQIKASSIILSLNSPVIDDMTTYLHLTTLDAEEFSGEAVDCFIEASYTGELETVNMDNFRHVNKMSHVFQVDWLVAKCQDYFISYLDKLDSESSHGVILFAVDEAVYLLSTMKKINLFDLAVKKIITLSVEKRDSFINEYLIDFANSSKYMIDACIAMVKSDVHVLVELLIVHLDQSGNISLDNSSRHLLKNSDMTLCFSSKPAVHARLFSVLNGLTETNREDLQLFLFLYKKMSIKQKKIVSMVRCLDPILKRSFKNYMSSDASRFFDELAVRKDVHSLYSFIDGIWSRMFNSGNYELQAHILQKTIEMKDKFGWGKISKQYALNLMKDPDTGPFLSLIQECDELVHPTGDRSNVLCEYSCEVFVRELFCKNNTFKFQIPGEDYSHHEFVLYTTAMRQDDPDSFDMQWGLLDTDVEVNSKTLPNLHFALEKCEDDEWEILPISWCGKPTFDKSTETLEWGYIRFHDCMHESYLDNMLVGEDDGMNWDEYVDCEDCLLRLICFVVDLD